MIRFGTTRQNRRWDHAHKTIRQLQRSKAKGWGVTIDGENLVSHEPTVVDFRRAAVEDNPSSDDSSVTLTGTYHAGGVYSFG